MRKLSFLTALSCFVWLHVGHALAIEFNDASFCRIPYSPAVVHSAQIDLPAEGVWFVEHVSSNEVAQLYLTPSKSVNFHQLGSRMQSVIHEKRTNQGQWPVRRVFSGCLEYARNHNGFGPTTLSDLPPITFEYLEKQTRQVPWSREELDSVRATRPPGPHVFVVPNVSFDFDRSNQRIVPNELRRILAVELHPYVNDGRHWVLYTDGSSKREPIDLSFTEKYGLQIVPILSEAIPRH